MHLCDFGRRACATSVGALAPVRLGSGCGAYLCDFGRGDAPVRLRSECDFGRRACATSVGALAPLRLGSGRGAYLCGFGRGDAPAEDPSVALVGQGPLCCTLPGAEDSCCLRPPG
eukprot:15436845-Alexandrium_andersonii.AAC.1